MLDSKFSALMFLALAFSSASRRGRSAARFAIASTPPVREEEAWVGEGGEEQRREEDERTEAGETRRGLDGAGRESTGHIPDSLKCLVATRLYSAMASHAQPMVHTRHLQSQANPE